MIFWIFASLLILLLIFTILIRNHAPGWGWNFLVLAVFLYAGLFKITGTPRSAIMFSTIENIHGQVEVVYSTVIDGQGIYLLVRDEVGHAPFYLMLPYHNKTAQALDKAKMEADQQHTAVMADADKLSEFTKPAGMNEEQPAPAPRAAQMPPADGGKTPGIKTNRDNYDNAASMFYPKPVPDDPLKNYHQEIITAPVEGGPQ